jgi:hypothetical protein
MVWSVMILSLSRPTQSMCLPSMSAVLTLNKRFPSYSLLQADVKQSHDTCSLHINIVSVQRFKVVKTIILHPS